MAQSYANTAAAGGLSQEQREAAEQHSLVDAWRKRIEAAQERDKDRVKKFPIYRKYVTGKVHGDDNPGLVRVPMIFVNQATIIPLIYAKNPEITVTPTESVSPGQYQLVKDFCRTLQLVLQRMFVIDGKLKLRVKSNLRSIFTTGEGWLKVTYQQDIQKDPIIQARINDAQDNLKRINYLIECIENGAEPGKSKEEYEAERQELELQLQALEQQLEVVAAEGLVIDRVLTEDILILDPTIKDFDYYVEARAIAHGLWFTEESYQETFGKWAEHDHPTLYQRPAADKDEATSGSTGKHVDQFIRVWEIWDRVSQTVYTWAEGMKTWCRAPYQPQALGERWYPFFRQGWNLQDGSAYALVDVDLQMELQDEYNTIRTNLADHRADSMPVRIARKGGSLTEADIDRINRRKSRDIILVEGVPDRPLQEDIAEFKNIPIDMNVYSTAEARADLELVAGRGDASAGTVAKAKTATEAEILREGLMSRSSERQDMNEDLIREMAIYAAEILLQRLSLAQVQRIAGPRAVWPQLSKRDIFDLVQIEIRAGSMGRPNRQRDREQWIQLYPVLKQGIIEIYQYRHQGLLDIAEALAKLLKETLTRFEERLDVEEFIGPMRGAEGGMVGLLYQQIAGLRQQLASLTGQPVPGTPTQTSETAPTQTGPPAPAPTPPTTLLQ